MVEKIRAGQVEYLVGNTVLDGLHQRQQPIIDYLRNRRDLTDADKILHYEIAMQWIRNDLAQKHPVRKY